MVAAGAVVHKDVPAYGLVAGNPARQVGWACVLRPDARCRPRLPVRAHVRAARRRADPGTVTADLAVVGSGHRRGRHRTAPGPGRTPRRVGDRERPPHGLGRLGSDAGGLQRGLRAPGLRHRRARGHHPPGGSRPVATVAGRAGGRHHARDPRGGAQRRRPRRPRGDPRRGRQARRRRRGRRPGGGARPAPRCRVRAGRRRCCCPTRRRWTVARCSRRCAAATARLGNVEVVADDALTVDAAGVHTRASGLVAAAQVVLATGAHTNELLARSGLAGLLPPLLGGRGVSVLVRATDPTPGCVRTPNRAFACGLHVVPRADGMTYLGATNRLTTTPGAGARAAAVRAGRPHRGLRPRARPAVAPGGGRRRCPSVTGRSPRTGSRSWDGPPSRGSWWPPGPGATVWSSPPLVADLVADEVADPGAERRRTRSRRRAT